MIYKELDENSPEPEVWGRSEYKDWSLILNAAKAKFRKTSSGHYYILCIFHYERTASLRLTQDGRYRCYGCGNEGVLLQFVEQAKKESLLPKNYVHTEVPEEPLKIVCVRNPHQMDFFRKLIWRK
jgi:CHC2 zinc finger